MAARKTRAHVMLSFASMETPKFRFLGERVLLGMRAWSQREEARHAAPAAEPRLSARSHAVSALEPAREMKVWRTDSPDECRLRIEGALDVHTAHDVRPVFDSVVSAAPRRVVLDLDELTMLDSSGVGALVSLFKRVKASGGRFVVRGMQGQPLAVCKLLKLDSVFGR